MDCHAANAARNDGVGALCEKVDSRIKLILGLNDSKGCGGAFGVFGDLGAEQESAVASKTRGTARRSRCFFRNPQNLRNAYPRLNRLWLDFFLVCII